jgi:hypothetical protein
MKTLGNMELIACDSRGIYIPQHVCEEYTLEPIHRKTPWRIARLAISVATCKEGPDAEGYWDAWSEVLDLACIRVGRARWSLYQDGDCWAIRMNKAGRAEAEWVFA